MANTFTEKQLNETHVSKNEIVYEIMIINNIFKNTPDLTADSTRSSETVDASLELGQRAPQPTVTAEPDRQ